MAQIWDYTAIVLVLLGPILASYMAVQVMRGNGLTRASGKLSMCDGCGLPLRWYELVPLLSFIWQRGKCRRCGKPIDRKIWLAEWIGLLLFFILALGIAQKSDVILNDITLTIYVLWGVGTTIGMLYLAIYDLFTYSIPRNFTFGICFFALAANALSLLWRIVDPNAIPEITLGRSDNLLMAAGFGGMFLLLIRLTKQRGMGMGDVLIGIFIGLTLGWPGTVSAFYAMILSASAVGLFIAAGKRKFKGLIIPLVPFMAFGFVVGYVYAQPMFSLLFRIN